MDHASFRIGGSRGGRDKRRQGDEATVISYKSISLKPS